MLKLYLMALFLTHEAGFATHRVSFDVSGEEGVMYAGAPARRTKEYEQMDAHTLLSIS